MKNNEPAFARPASRLENHKALESIYPGQAGMSLRDYFAAKAMQAIISTLATPFVVYETADDGKRISENAYKIADDMLKIREYNGTDCR